MFLLTCFLLCIVSLPNLLLPPAKKIVQDMIPRKYGILRGSAMPKVALKIYTLTFLKPISYHERSNSYPERIISRNTKKGTRSPKNSGQNSRLHFTGETLEKCLKMNFQDPDVWSWFVEESWNHPRSFLSGLYSYYAFGDRSQRSLGSKMTRMKAWANLLLIDALFPWCESRFALRAWDAKELPHKLVTKSHSS